MMGHQNEQICSSNTESWAAHGSFDLYVQDYTVQSKAFDEPE
jgi:hypothetical protein